METPPIENWKNSAASTHQQPIPKCIIPGSSKQNPNLPAIICFHGRGANATIFAIQARRLTYNLNETFRFIFIEAPFDSPAGPGVLPVFESVDPFYTWVRRKFVSSGVAGNPSDMTALAAATGPENLSTDKETDAETTALVKLIRLEIEMVPENDKVGIAERINEVVETEVRGGWDGVVGVMGFSQGARVASGLLLRQLKKQRDAAAKPRQPLGASVPTTITTTTTTTSSKSWEIPTKFKFGIFLGGPSPPILYLDEPVNEMSDEALQAIKSEAERDYALLRTVPTVLAWGRSDPWIDGCELLAEQCAGKNCFQMDFEGGHHLPLVEDESSDLCYFIRRAWAAVKDLQ